jgi:hypothetical protein
MKVEIYDEYGSSCIDILRLDGSRAVVDKDYTFWKGEYVDKGEGRSYYKGGIALKDGIIIINRRNNQRQLDNHKWAYMYKNNQLVAAIPIMRELAETSEEPKCNNKRFASVW